MNKTLLAQADDLKAEFAKWSVIIYTQGEKSINRASLLVEREAKRRLTQNNTVATGFLRASVTHRVVRRNSQIIGEIGSNVSYAKDVEMGSAPHYVSASDIGKWAKRKGIPSHLASYIALKISIYGTKPHPFLGPVFIERQAEILAMIQGDIKDTLK